MLNVLELYSNLNVRLVRWLISTAKSREDFTVTELLVLWKIHKRSTAKISEIAKEVGVPPSTMTGIFDRLETQGYVTRAHDLVDRRSVLVRETPKLSALVEEWKKSVNAELCTFAELLPEGFLDRFEEDLMIFKAAIDQGEEAKHGRAK